jgi:hypothetical protein
LLALAAVVGGSIATLSASRGVRGGSLEGDSRGTIVVWNHFHSGLPTAHVRGRLLDGNQVVGQFVCRLEDDGDVTGTAFTFAGPGECDGRWRIDGNDVGFFEVEIEHGDREIEIEVDFEGRHSFWSGDWEDEPAD